MIYYKNQGGINMTVEQFREKKINEYCLQAVDDVISALENISEKLMTEILPNYLHGGDIDEIISKLEEEIK